MIKNEIKPHPQSLYSLVTKLSYQVSFQAKNPSKRALLPLLSILVKYSPSKTLQEPLEIELLRPLFIE